MGSDVETSVRCLSTLKFWINRYFLCLALLFGMYYYFQIIILYMTVLRILFCSIVIHTLHADTNDTAPIALIGTRKDRITSPADHQRISTILYDIFSSSLAWSNVIENDTAVGANGRASLFFYPVDNVKGRSDPTVIACMKDIERVIDESDYVHQEQPLVYLQTIDKLTTLNKTYLSFDEAADVAIKCGVPVSRITHMLKLFHEMVSK